MELKLIAIAGMVLVALLVCGCAGVTAILVPALNNEAPANKDVSATIDPGKASDPVVGKWKMSDPIIRDGSKTLDMTDARWTFEADGSYVFCPLTIGIFKTTGTWTRIEADRYEVICGRDGEVKHFDLAGGQLVSEEDRRYLLARSAN